MAFYYVIIYLPPKLKTLLLLSFEVHDTRAGIDIKQYIILLNVSNNAVSQKVVHHLHHVRLLSFPKCNDFWLNICDFSPFNLLDLTAIGYDSIPACDGQKDSQTEGRTGMVHAT